MQRLQREHDVDVALPDRRHQVRCVVEPELACAARLQPIVVRLRQTSRRSSRSRISLPELPADVLRLEPQHLADLVARAARAHVREPVATRLGRVDVRISTVSEFLSSRESGAMRPLTRAPAQCTPTSVCTAKAKSSGVAPLGAG